MSKTRMLMQCISKFETPQGDTQVVLQAVISGSTAENRAFSEATPSATVSALISKGKAAAEVFEQGAEYFVDIEASQAVRDREGGQAQSLEDLRADAAASQKQS